MNPIITLIHNVNNLMVSTKQSANEQSISRKSNCASIPPSVTPIPAGNNEIPPNNVEEVKMNNILEKSRELPKA